VCGEEWKEERLSEEGNLLSLNQGKKKKKNKQSERS
jgi:hypothetical protein